jgi:hypothetical protein
VITNVIVNALPVLIHQIQYVVCAPLKCGGITDDIVVKFFKVF